MNQKIYHVRFKRNARGARGFISMEQRLATSTKIEADLAYNQICRFLKVSTPIELLTKEGVYRYIYSKESLDEYILSTYYDRDHKEEKIELDEITEPDPVVIEPVKEPVEVPETQETKNYEEAEEEHTETLILSDRVEMEESSEMKPDHDPIIDIVEEEKVAEQVQAAQPYYQNNQNKNYNKNYNQPKRKK